MTSSEDPLKARFDHVQRLAIIAAAAGGAFCLLGWLVNPPRFVQSYLVAFLFWVGISTACIAVVMLHELVGGLWGYTVRRPAEAGAMTIPLMALLFLPIALGLRYLYPWTDPSRVAAVKAIQAKVHYLNTFFFLTRAVIYFAIWSALALLVMRGAREQDRGEAPYPTRWLRTLSGPGLAIYFLSVTFAMIDWGMSLEPDWYSSIYGVMLLVGQVLAMLATLIIVATWLSDVVPYSEVATPQAFNDLGNLLLAFVMLWAYMSFSQYLITWSGNLVDEIPWYLRRSAGGWRAIAVALIIFHFFLPFFLLLSRDRKRSGWGLAEVAWVVLLMRLVDNVWLVIPAFGHPNIAAYWPVAAAMLGVGGLWVWLFVYWLRARPLLPRNDPVLAAVLEHHGE
jgi:hypothetical protein